MTRWRWSCPVGATSRSTKQVRHQNQSEVNSLGYSGEANSLQNLSEYPSEMISLSLRSVFVSLAYPSEGGADILFHSCLHLVSKNN